MKSNNQPRSEIIGAGITKGEEMKDKKDIIIWGYESYFQTENNKPRITKFKLSNVIDNLNFITETDENFPHRYYINRKDIPKD